MRVILSIDGGGIMGIGSAEFMQNMERDYKNFTDNIDAYAGTSVGSILATGASLGMSWSNIYTLFKNISPIIFKKPKFSFRMNPFNPKYDNRILIKELKKVFGSKRMSDVKKPLWIVAENFNGGRKPKVFDRTDSTFLWEAIATSCSAPTYFAPINGCIDGGLLANCPSMIALTSAVDKEGWKLNSIKILSLGTNGETPQKVKVGPRTTKLKWGKALLSTPTKGGEAIAVFQTKTILGDNVFRIEPSLKKDIAMDDVKSMDSYSKVWKELYFSLRKCRKFNEFLK